MSHGRDFVLYERNGWGKEEMLSAESLEEMVSLLEEQTGELDDLDSLGGDELW